VLKLSEQLNLVAFSLILEGWRGPEIAPLYEAAGRLRQRIEALLDPINALVTDLNRERRHIETWWARRAKRYEQLLRAASGLYGDIEGITGTLPKLTLEPPSDEDGGEKAA
jgi:hypothetical protein